MPAPIAPPRPAVPAALRPEAERHWRAGVEHDVINAGPAPLSFVEIETKRS